MSVSVRVVLDTSTLVSAALRVGSVPHKALARALQMGEVCVCSSTLAELEEVLMRTKFDRYQPPQTRQEFIAFMRLHTAWFDVSEAHIAAVTPPCRDPKDNQFLALVWQCNAATLVTSDADLLVLHPWHGVPIVSPAAYLQANP